ncbi:MAG: DUF3750 domain-containing protein [Pseudomonadota bacterium]
MRSFIIIIVFTFLLPMGAAGAWWSTVDRPDSWRQANWSATGLLPTAAQEPEAVVHIMAARTGGLKGAFSVHSWIVLKDHGAVNYERYDKVGWGQPVRRNAYAADANWYSNPPFIIKTVRGLEAALLIPMIRRAIAEYPHAGRGGYRIWPGPNSNSFVAHVLREVPEIGAVLPPNAVGKDWLAGGKVFQVTPDQQNVHLSVYGLAGLSAGLLTGFEINIFGQTLGFDFVRPALKLPAIGRVGTPL